MQKILFNLIPYPILIIDEISYNVTQVNSSFIDVFGENETYFKDRNLFKIEIFFSQNLLSALIKNFPFDTKHSKKMQLFQFFDQYHKPFNTLLQLFNFEFQEKKYLMLLFEKIDVEIRSSKSLKNSGYSNINSSNSDQIPNSPQEDIWINQTKIFSNPTEKLKEFFKIFPIPLAISDFDDNILYLNPKFQEEFGYNLNDFRTNNEWILKSYPDDLYRNNLKKLANIVDYINKDMIVDRKIKTKSGLEKYVIISNFHIENIDLTVFENITSWKAAQQEIASQEIELRTILDNANDLIIRFDNNFTIEFINKIGLKILNKNNFQEVITQNLLDFINPIYHNKFQHFVNSLIKNDRENAIFELEFMSDPYLTHTFEFNIQKFHTYDNKESIIGIGRNITVQKKNLSHLIRNQQLESLGILAGGIAHDFNNILTSILGNINLLQMDNQSNDNKDLLSDLQNATFQARDLANQLLTFAKGGIPNKELVDFEEILINSISFILRGRKSKAVYHLEPNLPAISMDKHQIEQVINNLIINADHSMESGGIINVYISNIIIENSSKYPLIPGKYIKTEIIDSGIGIPKEIQQKIFDPYFTTKTSGHGLGLSICYSIIQQHSGYISFESQEGKGSNFFFILPLN